MSISTSACIVDSGDVPYIHKIGFACIYNLVEISENRWYTLQRHVQLHFSLLPWPGKLWEIFSIPLLRPGTEIKSTTNYILGPPTCCPTLTDRAQEIRNGIAFITGSKIIIAEHFYAIEICCPFPPLTQWDGNTATLQSFKTLRCEFFETFTGNFSVTSVE